MKGTPSDLFIGAILRGYAAERAENERVTPSSIWDRICMETVPAKSSLSRRREHANFQELFAWDTSKASTRNRIATIRETIQAGYVPGLYLNTEANTGRVVVVRALTSSPE